jgi:N-acetyl sugar amidotransferase
MIKSQVLKDADIRVCSRCIYDERVNAIQFDSDGVCNYCHQTDALREEYGTGDLRGESEMKRIVEEIKKSGVGKKYDCIIGVSGGTDSSYMVYLAKKWGLRPLAVHYDNTWNTAIATLNIGKVLKSLDVDLYTHVVDNTESDDIFRSFFMAGVPEIEAATDLALAEVMYRAAFKYGVKYVLEGHSFITEGITPVGKNYFDGKYIQSIHKKYGKKKLKTYPLMSFLRMMFWSSILQIKKIRPFWYIKYSKEEAMDFLKKEFDWEYYGGHHLENRMTAFFHGVYLPQKFNADYRNNTLSAQARNNQKSREQAWKEYNSAPTIEPELIGYFKKRMGITDDEYNKKMSESPKSWFEFPTYKKRFERLRPLFHVLAKNNLVPMSFYLKYCFPTEAKK